MWIVGTAVLTVLRAERQLAEAQGSSTSLSHEPSQSSRLSRSVSVSEDDSAKDTPASQSSGTRAD